MLLSYHVHSVKEKLCWLCERLRPLLAAGLLRNGYVYYSPSTGQHSARGKVYYYLPYKTDVVILDNLDYFDSMLDEHQANFVHKMQLLVEQHNVQRMILRYKPYTQVAFALVARCSSVDDALLLKLSL